MLARFIRKHYPKANTAPIGLGFPYNTALSFKRKSHAYYLVMPILNGLLFQAMILEIVVVVMKAVYPMVT